MKTTLCLAAMASSLLLSVGSLHAADTTKARAPTLALPDLVVDKPVLDGNFQSPSMEWTFRNIGDADAHSTTALIKCEVIESGYPQTACGFGGAGGANLSIPPLAKGATFKHKIQGAVRIASDWTFANDKPYRVKFSAEVDPGQKIGEKTRSNNAVTFMLEHAAPRPTQVIAPPTPEKSAAAAPAVNVAVAGPSGAVGANPGAAVNPQPKLTLKTEDPWNPQQSNWIRVKNEFLVDAPAAAVKVTCLNMYAVKSNDNLKTKEEFMAQPGATEGAWSLYQQLGVKDTKCGFMPDSTKPIPALAKGQSANVLQVQPPPQVYPFQITFKLQGVGGADLVLSKP